MPKETVNILVGAARTKWQRLAQSPLQHVVTLLQDPEHREA